MLEVKIFTLYPDLFPGPLDIGIFKKAKENKIWDLKVINIRNYSKDKHGTVDDTPFGGGSGMLLRPDILASAIDENIEVQKFKVIDARSEDRFYGKVPEPRKGLRGGSIKNSFCIPFNDCLNDDKTFKNKDDLKKIFKTSIESLEQKKIVFSCGSGVTACVLALAYSLINDKYLPCIYDGSWAEYGLI